ncbi:glycosyltransferase [Methylobacillus arboreus]|uniref:glycosyltransferase n=1 Tax=Methylobacillus arboreus TaxID=755170 RepID=UPI001E3BE1D1|nr:glycosyltransferase [Methylobacillus arboreus]MCB5191834.1 glycosyltransferase [Methylobacillus arboreus]
MIGIVVPVHNEAQYLHACLAAITKAARHGRLQNETVKIVVVLDACSDESESISHLFTVKILKEEFKNVGQARAVGAEYLLAQGARWLAFTDADTIVDLRWIVSQLGLNSEAVCGTIQISDWSGFGRHAHAMKSDFNQNYKDQEGHRHIHGANLGISAEAYRKVGGFLPLANNEDVALVQALEKHGINIAWSAKPRVVTSARIDPRAPKGFGDTLLSSFANILQAESFKQPENQVNILG